MVGHLPDKEKTMVQFHPGLFKDNEEVAGSSPAAPNDGQECEVVSSFSDEEVIVGSTPALSIWRTKMENDCE